MPFYVYAGPISQKRWGDHIAHDLTAAKWKKTVASVCPQNLNSKTKIKDTKDRELGKLKDEEKRRRGKKKKNQSGSEGFQLGINGSQDASG